MIEGGVPFPMLSDAGGAIGAVYGVLDEAAGVDIRGRFLIDPDFVIRAMEVLTPEVGRNPRAAASDQSLPARARHGRGDTVRLEAGRDDSRSRSGSGRPGVERVEAGDGVLRGPFAVARQAL